MNLNMPNILLETSYGYSSCCIQDNLLQQRAVLCFGEITPEQVGMPLGALAAQQGGSRRSLFGLLRADGNLALAYPGCPTPVEAGCRLLYAKVVD